MTRFSLFLQKIKYLGALVSFAALMHGFVFAQGRDTVSFIYYKGKQKLVISYKIKNDTSPTRAFIKKGTYPSLDSIILHNPNHSDSFHFVDDKAADCYKVLYEKVTISDKAFVFDSTECKRCVVYMMKGTSDQRGTGNRAEVACKVEDDCNVGEVKGNSVQRGESSDTTFGVWLVILPLLLVIFTTIIVLKNKKKIIKNKISPSVKNTVYNKEEKGIEEYAIGLDAARQHIDDYYVMNLQEVFSNTAVHKIYLHHTAIKKMYDFFKTALESADQTTETGCYFVGCWEYDTEETQAYNISVEDIVEPGDDIVSDEYSFSFGGIIGIRLAQKISDLCQDTQRDHVHTVWMHSHPGLGLFLSEQDLLVQQLLTYSSVPNRLAAFVIDTNTPNWDLAVFSAKSDGTMNNKADLKRIYSLEELYKWCRQVHSSANAPSRISAETPVAHNGELVVNPDDYYAIPIKHLEVNTNASLFINGRTINTMDDIVYDCSGQNTLGGYLLGENDSYGNFRVDDCVRDTDTRPWGLFIVDSQLSNRSVVSNCLKETPALCVIVYRSDDEMFVFTREDEREPFSALSEADTCSMPSMKEWIRRRRIY